jgi:hypothetical protein
MKPAEYRPSQSKRPAGARKRLARLTLESLKDRITPVSVLAPPALLDPTAVMRVDQDLYTIRWALPVAAQVNTTVSAYRDSNANGVYDGGVD